MPGSRTFVVPASIDMVNVLGPRDEFLRIMERELAADIHVRGNEFTLTGTTSDIAAATEALTEVITILRTGQGLSTETVERVIAMGADGVRPAEILTQDILSSRGRTIRPKTLNQKRYVANQKGGVGKTTTAVNIAAALARGGLEVLVMDLDPQGNASTALGVDHHSGIAGTYEVLLQHQSIASVQQQSPESETLSVVPATIDLAAAEIELVPQVAREQRLKKALAAHLREHPVDYIIFDCPPSLGLLTINALVAASEILIPIQCEYYALEGVTQLMRTIQLVREELNPELDLSTILLTMFDARTKLSAQVGEQVRQHFPEQTLVTLIPRSVRLSEAPSYGTTILGYDPQSVGAKAYVKAAGEIARRGAEEPVRSARRGWPQ